MRSVLVFFPKGLIHQQWTMGHGKERKVSVRGFMIIPRWTHSFITVNTTILWAIRRFTVTRHYNSFRHMNYLLGLALEKKSIIVTEKSFETYLNGDDVFGCDLVEVPKLTASWSSLIMMMIACDAGRVLDNCILLFQWWQMRGSPQITPTLETTRY